MTIEQLGTCTEFQVRRSEVDARGLVHESVYLNWLNEAFLKHLQTKKLDLTTVQGTEYTLRLAEFSAKYVVPARLADFITAHCWISGVGATSIDVSFELLRGDTTLMTGDSRYACTGSDDQAIPVPSDWKAKMETAGNATH